MFFSLLTFSWNWQLYHVSSGNYTTLTPVASILLRIRITVTSIVGVYFVTSYINVNGDGDGPFYTTLITHV